MSSESKSGTSEQSEAPSENGIDRREAFRRIAKYGAYTAPAMLAMLTGEKAAAQETGVIK